MYCLYSVYVTSTKARHTCVDRFLIDKITFRLHAHWAQKTSVLSGVKKTLI